MRINSVVFISPRMYSKFTGMPMGIVYLASLLEERYQVHAYDFSACSPSPGRIGEILEKDSPQVVVIGGTSPSQPEAYALAKEVKMYDNRIIVVKGGPHEYHYAEKTAMSENIDYVLRDDGKLIVNLLKAIEDGVTIGPIISGSSCYHTYNALNRHLLYHQNPDYYNFYNIPTAQTRLAHGCLFNCSFCTHGHYSELGYEFVKNDLKGLSESGYQGLFWDDAIINANPEYLAKVLAFLGQFQFTMGASVRAGVHMDRELFAEMKQVGFRYLWMGFETADRDTLKYYRREDVDPVRVKESLDMLRKLGFEVNIHAIIGAPGENEETFRKTIETVKNIGPSGISVSLYSIYPGMDGCDEETYERPISREKRYMYYDEGYGAKVLVSPELAEESYFAFKEALEPEGIRMIDFEYCRTPADWGLPTGRDDSDL